MPAKTKKTKAVPSLFLKEDANFLEYPTWVISAPFRESKELVIKRENGKFVLRTTADRLPTKEDRKVVLCLIALFFQQITQFKLASVVPVYTFAVQTTTRELSKQVFGYYKRDYSDKRLEAILERLASTTIIFDGVFYENGRYVRKVFHYLSGYELEKETGELTVYLDEQLVKNLVRTSYFRFLNYKELQKLTSGVALRLFEVLCKAFLYRNQWKIGFSKLAQKLTVSTEHFSHFIREIKKAVKEINKKTSLKIDLQINMLDGIFTFRKLADSSETEKLVLDTDKALCDLEAMEFIGTWQDSKGREIIVTHISTGVWAFLPHGAMKLESKGLEWFKEKVKSGEFVKV